MTATATVPGLSGQTTTLRTRPRYEGSNICTWIGFKHINYLVEEAVLAHFRSCGHPVGRLYERHGLCLDIVDLDSKIVHGFHLDDTVTATVRPVGIDGAELRLVVELVVDRDRPVRAARAQVAVSLRLDPGGWPADPVPDELAPITVDRLGTPVGAGAAAEPTGRLAQGVDPLADLLAGRNGFGWVARMPYFYCHFTERVQMSGYLRHLEEALDLFMADRDASIKRMLDEQKWIPVVHRSSVTFLDEARMEEDLYTVFVVEEVFKRLTFTARMDCYVLRDGRLVPTATGRITHGWAVIEGRRAWSLATFDDRLLRVLTGGRAGTLLRTRPGGGSR